LTAVRYQDIKPACSKIAIERRSKNGPPQRALEPQAMSQCNPEEGRWPRGGALGAALFPAKSEQGHEEKNRHPKQ
jgi:hypothetical protein